MVLRSLFLLLLVSLTIYYAESVTCNFKKSTNDDDYEDDDGRSYGCELRNQSIESESDLSRIDGDHMQGMADGHVAWIESTDSTIRFFPNVLIEHFPNLTRAAFHNSQMTLFSRPINCGKLEHIGLDDNLLTDIPDGTFTNCSQLITLDLKRNNLENISEHSFSTDLYSLNLTQNRIRSIHPNAFGSYKNMGDINLHSIDLSYNLIEELPNFKPNIGLKLLNLDNNKIRQITPHTFGGFWRLKVLKLAHNRIEKLESGSFTELGQLRYLYLQSNYISEIEPEVFNIDFLYELWLSDNQLKELNVSSLNGLEFLNSLQIQHNKIERIDGDLFAVLPHLSTLNLTGNVCAGESFYLSFYDRHKQNFPALGTCGTSSLNSLPLSLLSVILIVCLIL